MDTSNRSKVRREGSFGSVPTRRSRRPAILAASVAGFVALWLTPRAAHGQTWTGATSGDWNTAANWNPTTVPNSTNAAVTFDASATTAVSVSQSTLISSLSFFTSTPYTISATPEAYLAFIGTGISNNSGVTQKFEAQVAGASFNFGQFIFNGSASAGNLTQFTIDGATNSGGLGARLTFGNQATAAGAAIITQGGTVAGASGGTTEFDGSTTAASATITTNGGINGGGGGATYFTSNADGGTARAITNGNGSFDISQLLNGGMKIGSIEGTGSYFLGSNALTVGGNNLSTIVTGVIADGGAGGGTGGALIKSGAATLTLAGANTYTGGTRINAGVLQLGMVGSAGALSATGVIGVNSGGTFQVVNAGANATIANNISNGVSGEGTVNMNSANVNTLTGTLADGAAGTLSLTQSGSGTTILANSGNTYSGATTVNSGTLQIGDTRAGSIGANSAVSIGGSGTLSLVKVNGNTFSNDVTGALGGNGNLQVNAGFGTQVTISGKISQQVGVTVSSGWGILTNTNNFYSGATTIDGGVLQVGTLTTAGSLGIATAVSIKNGGTLLLTNPNNNTVTNNISVGSSGPGFLTVGSTQTITLMGTLSDGAGALVLNVDGPGTTVLFGTNTFTGGTVVNGGTLAVNSALASGVTVNAGTLTGTSHIAGTVTLAGGTLVPGTINNAGTTTVGGLDLSSGNSNFRLGQPTGTNDLVNVNGNLAIGGNLNVLQQSGFTAGTYTLFNYTGALSTNGSGFTLSHVVGYNTSIVTTASQVQLQVSYLGGGQFWDGSGAINDGTISGGTGNWSTANNNWTDSTGTANSTWKGGTAIFGGTSGTVTLTSPISAEVLIFNSNGYSIKGTQNLTLAGSAPAILASTTGLKNTIGVPLVGSHGLTVGGVGTIALTNTANTYTGGTTVDGGTLQIGDVISAGSVGPGIISVGNGGTFALWKLSGTSFGSNITNNLGGLGTVNTTFLTPMTLTGTLTDGTGQLALDITLGNSSQGGITLTNAHNTYSGLTSVTQNTLQIGTTTTPGSIGPNSPVQVHIAGTLLLVNVAGNTFANNISNGGGNVGTVNVNSAKTNTLSGTIADGSFGTIAFTQSGTGTTILTNTNSYTGATSVTAGVLQIGNGSTGNLTGTSGVTVSNSASVTLNLADGATFSQPIILSASTTAVNATQIGTTFVTGVISGTGAFNQNGTGVTGIKGAETYTGATHVNAGTLAVDGSLAAGSAVTIGTAGTLLGAGTIFGNVTMTGNGTINLGTSGNIVGTLGIAGGNWSGAGSVGGVVTSSSGAFNLNGKLTATSGLSVTGGTLAGTGILTGKLNYTSGSNSTFDGLITGTGATLTKGGSSTLVLTFANTYTGATTVTGGTLQVGNGNSGDLAGTSGVTVSGGNFAINLPDGSTFALGVNLSAAGTLMKTIQSGTTTLTGAISGAGGLTQSGTGTTILPNAESYTGPTTVSAGTLQIDTSLAAGSTVNVGAAGTLTGAGTVLGKATMTGNGTINFGSGGNIVGALGVTGGNWSGTGTVGGLVTSSAGTFNLTGNLNAPAGLSITGGTWAGAGNVAGTVNYASNSNSTFSGIITGGGTLTKAGTSTLILNGSGSYTGATIINAGTLQMGDDFSGFLASTSGVIVSGTGTFATDLPTGLTFNPDISLGATTSSVKAIQSGTTTLNGIISGKGAFNQNGNGTTILGNVETYTGPTTVNAGTLELDGSLSAASVVTVGTAGTLSGGGTVFGKATLTGNGAINLSPGGNIAGTLAITGGNWNGNGTVHGAVTSTSGVFHLNNTLNAPAGLTVSGGTFDGAGTLNGALNYTSSSSTIFGGIIEGTGSLTKAGTSTLTLTWSNTYTGATTVTAGTLQIGDGSNGVLNGTSGITVSGTGALALDLADGSTFAFNVNLGAAGASLKAIQSGVSTLNGVISGKGAFNQNGTGVTILAKTETYTGPTTVSAGVLELDSTLSGSSVVNVGTAGTLTGTGTVRNKATLTGGGVINFGAGADIAGTLGITGGYWLGAGTVNGAVTSSSGVFNLFGILTAPAGLTVSGGTLAGTGTVIGNVNYKSNSSSAFDGIIDGAGHTLTKAGTSTFTLTGKNTYTGLTTITAGTLALGNGTNKASLGSGSVVIKSGATLALNLADGDTFTNNVSDSGHITDLASSGTHTISGLIIGPGTFTKTGAGTAILTGANSYSGATTISGGTLLVNNTAGSGTGSGKVSVNSGGTLGGSGTIKALTLNTGGLIAPGAGTPGVGGTTLNASSLIWNAGGTLKLQLGPDSDALALTGAFNKGTAGSYTLDLVDAGVTAGVYTLATFTSTNFLTSNFTLELPAGFDGTLEETSTSLKIDLSVHTSSEKPAPLIADEEPAGIATGPTDLGVSPSLVESSASLSGSDPAPITLVPTPEPGSTLLLAFGGSMVLGWRRRRKA